MGLFATPTPAYVPPAPAVPAQPSSEYWNQSHANLSREEQRLQREIEAGQLLDYGRQLAGFVLVGRHGDPDGVRLERRLQPSWPDELPQHIRQVIDQAIAAHAAARQAAQAAVMGYRQWEQQHPNAPDEVRRVEAYRQCADQDAAAQRAGEVLDKVLTKAGGVVRAIERRRAVDAETPRLQAAEERRHAQVLAQIDRDQADARMAVQSAIAQF